MTYSFSNKQFTQLKHIIRNVANGDGYFTFKEASVLDQRSLRSFYIRGLLTMSRGMFRVSARGYESFDEFSKAEFRRANHSAPLFRETRGW